MKIFFVLSKKYFKKKFFFAGVVLDCPPAGPIVRRACSTVQNVGQPKTQRVLYGNGCRPEHELSTGGEQWWDDDDDKWHGGRSRRGTNEQQQRPNNDKWSPPHNDKWATECMSKRHKWPPKINWFFSGGMQFSGKKTFIICRKNFVPKKNLRCWTKSCA